MQYKFKFLNLLIFTCLWIRVEASPLLFSNSFEVTQGSIEFISFDSVLFSDSKGSSQFEVLVKDHLGNVIQSDDIQWSLSSGQNVNLSDIQSRTVKVEASSFTVSSIILTAYHPEVNAKAQAIILMAELASNTRRILDEDVISGSTPIDGNQNNIVLQNNNRTNIIQVGDYVLSEQNKGIIVKANQVASTVNEITITASRAPFSEVFQNFSYSGVSQTAKYSAKVDGPKNEIKFYDSKNGNLAHKQGLFDLFKCELNDGSPAGINYTKGSFDYDFDITFEPKVEISEFTLNEMSLVAKLEERFAFTTGSFEFDSSISGGVDCKVQNLPGFKSPSVSIYGFFFNITVNPELGFKVQANIQGPSAKISGPSGITRSSSESGVRFNKSSGWNYINSESSDYNFDVIDGEFSNDVVYSFSAEAYALAKMGLNASLGKVPFGVEIGQFDFMEAKYAETFNFNISAPLDPNNIHYSGPDAALSGELTIGPKTALSGPLFDQINNVFGIDLSFDLSIEPLVNETFPHWESPKPIIFMPDVIPLNSNQVLFIEVLEADNSSVSNGSFEIISETLESINGSIENGIGEAEVMANQLGVHIFYSRLKVDRLSQVLPYSSDLSKQFIVGDSLISEIEVEDPNLKNCIDLISNDEGWVFVSEVTYISCPTRQLNSLLGIQNFYNINYLELSENQIQDVYPLAYLINLKWLYLGDNNISDIEPLGYLIHLEELSLYENFLFNEDFFNLAPLTNLKELNISGNAALTDISFLKSLIKLEVLNMVGLGIFDIVPLENLQNLIYLNLLSNQITNISPIGKLNDLQYLNLGFNYIDDISDLFSLEKLEFLDLLGNKNLIPCDQLSQFSYVNQFEHDPYYNVDGGSLNLPITDPNDPDYPGGIDQYCGPF